MAQPRFRALAAGLLLGVVALLPSMVLAPSSAWADESPSPTATRAPYPLEANSVPQVDGEDSARERELERKYGHDRDIAAPPMLVKRSTTATTGFVSQPLRISHPGNEPEVHPGPNPPALVPHSFYATRNQPVIQTLGADGFSSPAQEFARAAYLGMGVLAVAAAALGVFVLRRYRARGSAIDDFDYQPTER